MKAFTIISLLILFSITSYTQGKMITKITGIYKTPRWQTTEHIEELSKHENAYYDALYCLKNFEDLQFFNKNKLLSFPGVCIFDKNLNPIKALNATDCGWQAQRFISTLTDTTTTLTDDRVQITAQDLFNHSNLVDGDSNIVKKRDFDYLYIYTWVAYLPKFMKDQFVYSQRIAADKNVRIKIISLNVDFMDEWNDRPKKIAGKKVREFKR
jgi:hypothetical protein